MNDRTLLGAGLAVVAVCCFVPALILLLGTVGMSAWLARLDFVLLLTVLVVFGLANWILIRRQK